MLLRTTILTAMAMFFFTLISYGWIVIGICTVLYVVWRAHTARRVAVEVESALPDGFELPEVLEGCEMKRD